MLMVSDSDSIRKMMMIVIVESARDNNNTQEHTTALTYVNLKAGISMEVCMYDKVGRPVHV